MNKTLDRLVLDFHGIGEQPHAVDADEDRYWCHDVVAFEGLLDAIPEVTAATGLAIELTFDDGNASDARIAAPALGRRGLSAGFYICAGRIDAPGYLGKAELADMAAAGFTIGSHGWSHTDWRKTDGATLEHEVHGARRKIEDVLGRAVDGVAIPFGSYDRRVMAQLATFKTVYTSDDGMARAARRIVPRWSYRRDWHADSLMQLAEVRESKLTRAIRALKIAIKQRR